MSLTVNPHLVSILKVDDVEDTARQILCKARDEEFEPTEYPLIPVYFKNRADAVAVVNCLNERYWGGHSSSLVICIYH